MQRTRNGQQCWRERPRSCTSRNVSFRRIRTTAGFVSGYAFRHTASLYFSKPHFSVASRLSVLVDRQRHWHVHRGESADRGAHHHSIGTRCRPRLPVSTGAVALKAAAASNFQPESWNDQRKQQEDYKSLPAPALLSQSGESHHQPRQREPECIDRWPE